MVLYFCCWTVVQKLKEESLVQSLLFTHLHLMLKLSMSASTHPYILSWSGQGTLLLSVNAISYRLQEMSFILSIQTGPGTWWFSLTWMSKKWTLPREVLLIRGAESPGAVVVGNTQVLFLLYWNWTYAVFLGPMYHLVFQLSIGK